jgi:dihydroflavonol-4-reductase
MAQVLVTGGTGFVGRHLVEALVARGDAVRVLDIAAPHREDPSVEFLRGSINDRATCERALDGVDLLYHVAGIAHLWQHDKDNFDRVNRRGTETVLAAAVAKRVARVVHCSTESILLPKQRNGRHPVNESASPTLEDMAGPYTRSKFLGERAALHAAYGGMALIVVNPTVPIGVGDHNMTPPAVMLDIFLSGRSPFFLDCELNLVDVRDVAEGIIRAGDHGRPGERYILGGENVSMRDLLMQLERISGRRMPKRRVPVAIALATGFVSAWIADNVTHKSPAVTHEAVLLALRSAPFDSAKAVRELGYAPRPIEQALTEVIEAFKRKSGWR